MDTLQLYLFEIAKLNEVIDADDGFTTNGERVRSFVAWIEIN